MTIHILIINRLIKFSGALIKTLAYLVHFMFPNKRFEIPFKADAWIRNDKKTNIPKIIWQTNFTNKVTFPVYINYLFNRLMSLKYEYRYCGNEECLEMFEEYGTQEEIDTFKKLAVGAAKADYWRVFALNKFGGVYLDMDATFVYPLRKMIDKEDDEVYLLHKNKYTNFFIASKANTEILNETNEIIIDNVKNFKNDASVFVLTGPMTVIRAIGEKKVKARTSKYTCIQGSFTNEYFQYIDKPNSKWIHAKADELLKKDDDNE